MKTPDPSFGQHLKDALERLMCLEETKIKLKQDFDQIYKDAKMMGYDTKVLKNRRNVETMGVNLQSFLKPLLRLDDHKKNLNAKFTQVYKQAKKLGYDVKVLKQFTQLHIQRAYDSAYNSDVLKEYKQVLEAEDERLFFEDPERFKTFYFNKWIQLDAKFRS